ncbi:MAG TPA: response regulator [Actinomycetota bacterium]
MLEQRTTEPSAAATAGPPILLVEDDRGQSRLVERVFRKAGVANPLRIFHEGNGALAYLEGQEGYADRTRFPLPVLVLLDVHIPGRSGLELLTWLRQQPALERIPVVMLSGSSESEDIDRAFELGANSYLVKPVAFDALLDTVSGLGLPWMILGRDGEGGDG